MITFINTLYAWAVFMLLMKISLKEMRKWNKNMRERLKAVPEQKQKYWKQEKITLKNTEKGIRSYPVLEQYEAL